MVHTAARSMVVETLGDDAWQSILAEAQLNGELFISGQNYSDEVTFALIGAIAKVSGIEPENLLRLFGEYWIRYAAQSPYGTMFRIGGNRLDTFLSNLNRMHASIHSTMPASRMPSFEMLRQEGNRIDMLYTSDREGLTPFVEGLLKGLMTHFGETGHVSHSLTHEGDVFSLNCETASSALPGAA
ncbi:heme NO-binding domain-containing protein [Hyphomonas sp. WL0036]|uniref:heme NO-binding domain-containing protein n=1 Tax=Hyphomonas sediminis TaxID=2866160 RepID=UPI001C7F8164|nr:heme NO-binding domain-containing protein [Hyphomonas sediminis]MBY9068093.1 heme NO-binding domain-containing protein [Hyphomonas sediminis]